MTVPIRDISIDRIAELLRDTKEGNGAPKACLLIGAGVSKSAGIGMAGDFVKRIQKEYPEAYRSAQALCAEGDAPSYAQCMAQLPPAKQVQIVRASIDAAKVNWAHIGIARMERDGVVDTILTPNFDPLASRACAMFHRFPSIYDLAAVQGSVVDRSFVKGSAIFHLHGQHTGFRLFNTDEELQAQAKKLQPILNDVAKGKPIIIAGYSGENDPLIDQIANLSPFNHGLFWVRHDGSDPASSIREKLLSLPNCYVVRNKSADVFFTELADTLKLDPPQFLAEPFSHMISVLNTLQQEPQAGCENLDKLREGVLAQLESAKTSAETATPQKAAIAKLMAAGQFESVWANYGANVEDLDPAESDLVAWAAVMLGNALLAQAKSQQGEAAAALYAQACEKYAAALAIKPDKHEALNNWGNALSDQARTQQGEAAAALYAQAYEKYAAALAIKPDMHEALFNWGNALLAQAQAEQGEAASALYKQAIEKLSAGERITPGSGAYNLACAHARLADPVAAAGWLVLSHSLGQNWPGCAHALADPDFALVKDSPEFQAALASIGCTTP